MVERPGRSADVAVEGSNLKDVAKSLGFLRVGVARANRSPNADAYLRWLDRGQHAQMHYMARNVSKR